jgi:hypothetical protein
VRKLRGLEARGGAHRGMADGGGARPESEGGRGFRWPEAVVRAQGAVGKGVALERGVQRGVCDGGADGRSGVFRTAGRRHGRGGKREGGTPAAEVLRGAGGVMGPGPDRPETERGGLIGGPRHSVGRRCH